MILVPRRTPVTLADLPVKTTLPLLALLSLLAACGQEAQARSRPVAGDGNTEAETAAVGELGSPALETRLAAAGAKMEMAAGAAGSAVEKFRISAKPSLDAVDQRVAQLERKLGVASSSARAELERWISDLRERRKAIGLRIFDLKKASPEGARAGLEELEVSLADLRRTADDALARFR